MIMNKCIKAALAACLVAAIVLVLTVQAAPAEDEQQQVVEPRQNLQLPKFFDFANYKQLFKKNYSGALENMKGFKLFTSRAQQKVEEPREQRVHFQLPKLFDFENYKQLFKKTYSGALENMMRFKLFTSRAMRAFISAIKFKFREAKFHLAINHMSDMSEAELDKMRNRKLEQEFASDVDVDAKAEKKDDLPEFIPSDGEDAVEVLRKAIDEHRGEPGFEELHAQLQEVEVARKASRRRRKRDVNDAQEVAEAEVRPPRELPLDKLISSPPGNYSEELSSLSARARAKIREHPASDNPFYAGIEPMTEGLRDQQVKLDSILFEVKPPKPNPLFNSINRSLESLRMKYMLTDNMLSDAAGQQGQVAQQAPALPDEVFIDLREESDCFFAPRSQSHCGSCYAFAAITVAEYLHCKTTGELVPFSEQYVIDCGKPFTEHLFGCDGGSSNRVNEFFQNFGWELRMNYPYAAREQQCPYSEDTDLRSVGYIKGKLRKNAVYEIGTWPSVLKTTGPLVVNMNTGPEFREYGSGVYDACVPQKPTHAVVLIGHGREDGEEYWLIRNSHSVGWGEGGHMKLSKKADCLWPHNGYTFGTEDGQRFSLRLGINKRNNGKVIKNQYVEKMIQPE